MLVLNLGLNLERFNLFLCCTSLSNYLAVRELRLAKYKELKPIIGSSLNNANAN